ncbi:zinc ribbon domain-containing protein [Polaromonas sp.]|uniref:zinc ribbon domain-containing protein n=1 Tax=Polaromonas sp. TaxID=1869339 RepID=UPI00352A1C97
MALVACSECGKQISTLAATCPSCGAPVAGSPASARPPPLVNAGVLGKAVVAIGAWLVVPWVVRLLAFLAGIAMLIVMFRSAR